MLTLSGMTDSEKNDFINFIYGQLKEREAQNEALHAKLDAQMDRFDKLQATLDAISSQLAESNKMKEVLQKGFDNMQIQLGGMKDAIVNCDETWCRVKMQDKYKKAYIWCLVNKAAKIVIFFYDNGSRGRKVLTDFIGDAGVESSAVYHTIIATCKAQAISVCDYLKRFFMACVDGRTDYERSSLSRLLPTGRKNLTPMMLCQPVK